MHEEECLTCDDLYIGSQVLDYTATRVEHLAKQNICCKQKKKKRAVSFLAFIVLLAARKYRDASESCGLILVSNKLRELHNDQTEPVQRTWMQGEVCFLCIICRLL